MTKQTLSPPSMLRQSNAATIALNATVRWPCFSCRNECMVPSSLSVRTDYQAGTAGRLGNGS